MTNRHVAQHKAGKSLFLAGASAGAAALALALPQPAFAQQAVNATVAGASGASVSPVTGASNVFVNVNADQALIDWDLDATGVSTGVFLNAGGSLDFSRDGAAYTVLNRVNPMSLTGTLALNGSVTSDAQGKIWFYNPGGWVVGNGATIDVGALVLTANPITIDAFDPDNPNTSGFYGPNGEVRFGAALAGSQVVVNPGARILANQTDSYVALVAPRIEQRGDIATSGGAALVAADAVDVTINNGLFDIVVSQGTSDANGVVHRGNTEGTQGQYLVAVPKNDALTMLVSGNVGFSPVSVARVAGGKIVLSSGFNVASGSVDTGSGRDGGNVSIADAVFSNDADVYATGSIAATADGVEAPFETAGTLNLIAGNSATGGSVAIDVLNGGSFFVQNDLNARADGLGAIVTDPTNGDALAGGVAGADARGGSVKVDVGRGSWTVGGQTVLSADAFGGLGGASAGSATGGSVSLTVQPTASFQTEATGGIFASASASGQFFGAGPDTGASGTGGTVDLNFASGFTTDAIQANAFASAAFGSDRAAQRATGGVVELTFTSATVNAGSVFAQAGASASDGGVANGGRVATLVDGAALSVSGTFQLSLGKSGNAGSLGGIDLTVTNGGSIQPASSGSGFLFLDSGASGNTTGLIEADPISLNVNNGSIANFFVLIDASAFGGSGRLAGGRTDAKGGAVTIAVDNAGVLSGNALFASANGRGGSGGEAGDGLGGSVSLGLRAGSVNFGTLELSAEGSAGATFSGLGRTGIGHGGTAALVLNNGSANFTGGRVSVRAPGTAGGGIETAALARDLAGPPGGGGNGVGGTAQVALNGGTFTADSLTIEAFGLGGNGFSSDGNIVSGKGGTGGSGIGGGTALGGQGASFLLDGSDATIGSIVLDATGRGGAGADQTFVLDATENAVLIQAGDGGVGAGGSTSMTLSSGQLATSAITLDSSGNKPVDPMFGEGFTRFFGVGGYVFGENGGKGGTGGAGQGGSATFLNAGASLTDTSDGNLAIGLDVSGFGGNGGESGGGPITTSGFARGDGGTGSGGVATFTVSGGSTDFSLVTLDASGNGGHAGAEEFFDPLTFGDGGNGGSGVGGVATISLNAPMNATNAAGFSRFYRALASGIGADGGAGIRAGDGGNGSGGSATLSVSAAGIAINSFYLDGYGGGGQGGQAAQTNRGGNGGGGIGGSARLITDSADTIFAPRNGQLYAEGRGGGGGNGGNGGGDGNQAGNGGAGGNGRGGVAALTAQNGATLDYTAALEFGLSVNGIGGDGGLGGDSNQFYGDGGNAGSGTGGTIALSALEGTLRLGAAGFSADGFGGAGGGRQNFETSSSDSSRGGDGGAGFGGAIDIVAAGTGGLIQAGSLTLATSGFGGSGAAGQGFDPSTFVGASGGAGKAGSGGTITLDASGGATIAFGAGSASTFFANGEAGSGGRGADGGASPASGAGGNGGTGGDSGQGNGGTIEFLAHGGSISGGDFNLFVNGTGRIGAPGGAGAAGAVPEGSPVGTPPGPAGAAGAGGIGGGGVGGRVAITGSIEESGRAGGLALGAVAIDLNGFIGDGDFSFSSVTGTATITDSTDASNGGFRLGSLNVSAFGDPVFNPVSLSIVSGLDPIRVSDSIIANVSGTADILAIGTGGLDVAGDLAINAGAIRLVGSQGGLIRAGSIFLSSTGITLVSAQDCTSPSCPVVAADGIFRANADGDFALLGPSLVSAGTSLDIRSESDLTGEAGSGFAAPQMTIGAARNVTVRNARGGLLDVQAGAAFGEGGVTFGDGLLTLGEAAGIGTFDLPGGLFGLSGGDIAITDGTQIDTVGGINLNSGDDIRIGSGAQFTNARGSRGSGFVIISAGQLATTAPAVVGNVASLFVGDGASIDGTDGAVVLNGGAIDGRGAMFRGARFSADVTTSPATGTQLSDNGDLTAPCLEGAICLGAITVTGDVAIGLGEIPPLAFTGFGSVAGGNVSILTRETLTYGAAGSALSITSPGRISLESQNGDIALVGNALLDGGTLALAADGSVTGNGRLQSDGDVGIDVGDSVALDSVVAGGQLTTIAGIGGTPEPLFSVPGSLTIGALQVGTDQAIAGGGSIAIGSAAAGGNDLSLSAGTLVSLGASSAIDDLALDGADVSFGMIAANGSIALTADNAIAGTWANAGDSLSATGATLTATMLNSGGAMALTTSGAMSLGTATSGANLAIGSGALAFATLTPTGATRIAAASVTGGDVAAGTSLRVTSPGAIGLGTATAGTTLALAGASVGATTLQSGGATTLTSSGQTTIGTATSGAGFASTSGSLAFLGVISVGDIALGSGSVSGGNAASTNGSITLTASGPATVGQLRAANDVVARATTFDFARINAGLDATLDVTTLGGTAIAAGRDLTIRSVNDLTFGSIAAVRNLTLSASQGAITINSDIDAGGAIALAGDAVLVKAAGPLSIASVSADNGDIGIATGGLLTVSGATALGDIALTSTANSLVLGPLTAGRAPQSATALNASGTSKGTPGPGAIALNAAQAITMQGSVDALTALSASAGTLIDQRAQAVGKTIAYRSADLALGQAASLGQSSFTTGITLTNTGSAGALLGDGTGTASGYRVDNAEFGRIRSGGDLSLAAGSSLGIGTLTANASGSQSNGNIGPNGTLALTTGGDLSVSGALSLGNAAGNTLRLSGGTLSVDATNGSVRLDEGAGRGGTLAVSAGEITALTSAARSAIAGLDANGINLRLAQNDGVSDGRTLFEAGAINLTTSGRVLIQNTATGQTFNQRRGFVADSFAITTTGSPLIVINGTVGGQTGLDALRSVQVVGGFDDLSTVNGCRLLTASCGLPQFDPLRGLIEEEIGEGNSLEGNADSGFGTQPLIQINRFEPVGFEAVIDEPVTGSGNDDFLVPEAGAGDEQCTEEDRTKCDKPPAG